LQGKLKDKQGELAKETQEKERFKELANNYQSQIASLQA
jgi:hypothetical protein